MFRDVITMNTLLIDTSTTYLFVSFFNEDTKERLFYKKMISHNNHSENLIPALTEVLNECNMELKDVDEVVCGIGPGSYTGLRVGCVVAKMASYTLNKPLKTISSLLFCGSGKLNNGKYLIKMKAKKDYSYYTIVNASNNKLDILTPDSFNSDSVVNEIINNDLDLIVIDESSYEPNPMIICKYSDKVTDVHNLTPNYLRNANQ